MKQNGNLFFWKMERQLPGRKKSDIFCLDYQKMSLRVMRCNKGKLSVIYLELIGFFAQQATFARHIRRLDC